MQLFYAPNICQSIYQLDETESRHCVQVLRHKTGDTIQLIDGQGGWYQAHLTKAHAKQCTFQIIDSKQQETVLPFHLHIAIAPPKNRARLEWFLEKATEIGVTDITLIITKHSERRKAQLSRLQKVILSAAKQSGKAHLPILHELTDFVTLLEDEKMWQAYPNRYIAYLGKDMATPLLKNVYQSNGNNTLICIGPEGGFHSKEGQAAKQKGFVAVSLGKSRLRTETAGIVACHTVHLLQ